jgi:nitrogen fixation protein NifU and related proteins
MALSADPPPPVSAPLPPDPGVASLYQEIILSHYRAPKHKGVLDAAPVAVEHRNPLCGDVMSVQLSMSNGQITNGAFTARACSITQATASMVLERIIGGSSVNARAVVAQVEQLLDTTAPLGAADVLQLGDLRALASVSRFPARKACVRLVLGAVREALDSAV